MSANRWAVAASIMAVLGAIVASFAPLGQLCTASVGTVVEITAETCRGVSLFSQEGAWILVVVSVPVLVALVPVLVSRRPASIGSAALLWMCCLVAASSVGLFFVPAAILMTVAATKRQPDFVPPAPLGTTS